MGRLEGVKKSETDWKAGLTVVTFKEGASLDPNQLAKAMDAAGFGVDEITLIARGNLIEEKGYPAFKVSGSNQIFLLAENEVLNQLKALGSGKEATITAKVEMKEEGTPFTLILEKVESPTL